MRVALFITCFNDTLFPETGRATVEVLERMGLEVDFPFEQTCCGQMHFNTGYQREAIPLVRRFVRVFKDYEAVVAPSGSCVAMVEHHLPELVGCEPFHVYELSAFLDEQGAEIRPVNEGRTLAYHDSCHMLRELGISDAPRRLLERSGARLVPLPRPDLCCGFGGTFSVRQPEISVAMADEKLAGARGADALVTADPGCLMHLRARGERTDALPLVHLATALVRGV